MRATKLVSLVKNLSYIDRLKKLKLPTLKFRRIRGDMIEVYKINNLKYDACTTVALGFNKDSKTRGNKNKLIQNHCKYNLRKHYIKKKLLLF